MKTARRSVVTSATSPPTRWAVFDPGKPRVENPVAVAETRRDAGIVAARLTTKTGRKHFRAPIGPDAILPPDLTILSR